MTNGKARELYKLYKSLSNMTCNKPYFNFMLNLFHIIRRILRILSIRFKRLESFRTASFMSVCSSKVGFLKPIESMRLQFYKQRINILFFFILNVILPIYPFEIPIYKTSILCITILNDVHKNPTYKKTDQYKYKLLTSMDY